MAAAAAVDPAAAIMVAAVGKFDLAEKETIMKAIGLGVCLTLAATVSVAAPTGGRLQNPVFAPAGIMGVVGPGTTTGVASAGKNMTSTDAAVIKAMGDGILLQPKGAYRVGLTRFKWNVQGVPDRTMTMLMWIDGDYAPNIALKGVNEAAANVSFCRVVGVTFTADVPLTIESVKDMLDRTVQSDFPHHTKEVKERHPWAEVFWRFCKRNDSDGWAVIRGGNGIGGKQEWVYLGDYVPAPVTAAGIEWADIPDHRRNWEARRALENDVFPPVNKYDAAFQHTPGDVDGMMDVDPATRGNQ